MLRSFSLAHPAGHRVGPTLLAGSQNAPLSPKQFPQPQSRESPISPISKLAKPSDFDYRPRWDKVQLADRPSDVGSAGAFKKMFVDLPVKSSVSLSDVGSAEEFKKMKVDLPVKSNVSLSDVDSAGEVKKMKMNFPVKSNISLLFERKDLEQRLSECNDTTRILHSLLDGTLFELDFCRSNLPKGGGGGAYLTPDKDKKAKDYIEAARELYDKLTEKIDSEKQKQKIKKLSDDLERVKGENEELLSRLEAAVPVTEPLPEQSEASTAAASIALQNLQAENEALRSSLASARHSLAIERHKRILVEVELRKQASRIHDSVPHYAASPETVLAEPIRRYDSIKEELARD